MEINNRTLKTTLEVGDLIKAVNMGKTLGDFVIEKVDDMYAFDGYVTFKREIKDNGLIDRVDIREEPKNTEYKIEFQSLFQTYDSETHKTPEQVLSEGFRTLANEIEGSNLDNVRSQVLTEMLRKTELFLRTSKIKES